MPRKSSGRVSLINADQKMAETAIDAGADVAVAEPADTGGPPSTAVIEEQGRERAAACKLMREMAEDLNFPTACTAGALVRAPPACLPTCGNAPPRVRARPADGYRQVIYHAYRTRREARTGGGGRDSSGEHTLDIPWWCVESSACILIAAKVKEVPRKVRDIVNVAYQRVHPARPPLQVGAAYWGLRDAIVACEQDLLRSQGFAVLPPLPFNYLLNYLKALGATPLLSQTAFCVLDSSCDLPLCMYFSPRILLHPHLHAHRHVHIPTHTHAHAHTHMRTRAHGQVLCATRDCSGEHPAVGRASQRRPTRAPGSRCCPTRLAPGAFCAHVIGAYSHCAHTYAHTHTHTCMHVCIHIHTCGTRWLECLPESWAAWCRCS